MRSMKISVIAAILCLALCLSCVGCFAEEAAAIPTELNGTYVELFPAMDAEEVKPLWYSSFKTTLGVEDESVAEMLRSIIIGMFEADAYGEDALALAAEDPTYYAFNCYFLQDVATFVIKDGTITGYDAAGEQLFSHAYTYVESLKTDFGPMTEMYGAMLTEETWPTFDLYVSDGEDDGFKYFAFSGDTPATTWHIEFRYGASAEDITAYFSGKYAYWLASGFPTDAGDDTMQNVVDLFVAENADSFAAMVQ